MPTVNQNDIEQPAENIYSQNYPEQAGDVNLEPQILPIHFNFNFIERDRVPLHNVKYSKTNDEYSKQTEIIHKGFFDNSLPTPSHVILNHINSWSTMYPRSEESQREKFSNKRTAAESSHATNVQSEEKKSTGAEQSSHQ